LWALGFGLWLLGFVASCARPHVTLPTDPGIPLPDFTTIHMQVSAACVGVRTLTAEMALSGRAGRQRLRGRVLAGFARPASMRLEGVAPFGPPAFILVARGENATLLLPRDERVLRGAKPEDILGALAGVTLGPADLQAILTGCVVPAPQPMEARRHANGWASIDLAGGATIVDLRRDGEMALKEKEAEKGDADEVTIKTKDNPPAMVTAMRRMSGRDLRAEVLTAVAKRDRALFEEFFSKIKSESDSSTDKSAPLLKDDWLVPEAVAKRIQVASALLNEGQTEKALEYALPVLTAVNMHTINFLSELRAKNAGAASLGRQRTPQMVFLFFSRKTVPDIRVISS